LIFAGIASLAVLPLPPLLVLKAAVLIGMFSSAALAIYWLTQAIDTANLNQGAKTSQEITQAQRWEPSTPPTQGTKKVGSHRPDQLRKPFRPKGIIWTTCQ
jgi:hypothetical protein